MTRMNEAPQHMTELRHRLQKMVPGAARFSQAADAVNNLGATEAEQNQTTTVEFKTSRFPAMFNWTGTFLVAWGRRWSCSTLSLPSGTLFTSNVVHVMPRMSDKKQAVEISHEIQQKISIYLFSVSLINIGVGILVSASLYWLGIPNAAMWGALVALMHFIPYFGPVAGILLLGAVGLLTFDTLGKGFCLRLVICCSTCWRPTLSRQCCSDAGSPAHSARRPSWFLRRPPARNRKPPDCSQPRVAPTQGPRTPPGRYPRSSNCRQSRVRFQVRSCSKWFFLASPWRSRSRLETSPGHAGHRWSRSRRLGSSCWRFGSTSSPRSVKEY